MGKPAALRFSRACPGSGVQVPLTWAEADDRDIERACPICGRLLGMRAIVGGSAARRLGSAAATVIPRHNRRKEGEAP